MSDSNGQDNTMEQGERRTKRAKTEETDGDDEREELLKENAEKDKQLAEFKKQNAEKDKQDKQLAEFKKQNVEKDKQLAKFQHISLKRLLTAHPKIDLKQSGSGKSHTGTSAHKKGRAEEKKFVLGLQVQQPDQSPPKSIAECWDMPSMLLTSLRKANPPPNSAGKLSRSFSTEADISSLISHALTDASFLAGKVTGMNFETRHETSLFAQRPDHLVVYDASSGLPLLSVEDKKPWGSHVGVKGLETVVGQIYDYATAMRAFGNAAPFVVLTCFTKSFLFWLDDNNANSLANNETCRNEKSFEKSRKNNLDRRNDKNTPSPPELKSVPENGATQIVVGSTENTTGHGTFSARAGDDARMLNYSQQNGFDYKSLVPLLYTAILCAVKINPQPERFNRLKITQLSKGVHFDDGALKLKQDTHDYEWGRLNTTVGEKILEQTSSSRLHSAGESCFYAVSIVGVGSTSKVFLALDQNGEPCVIKMYVKRKDDETRLYLSFKDFQEKALKKTQKEVANLLSFYPFLKGKVKHQMVIGFHCVVMPFFKPLSKTERPEKENEIKAVLREFYNEKRQQNDVDLRWRHVGLYTDAEMQERLVLYDLADLESINSEEDPTEEAFVDRKWEILRERLDDGETE
jgi:hypothetical protein